MLAYFFFSQNDGDDDDESIKAQPLDTTEGSREPQPFPRPPFDGKWEGGREESGIVLVECAVHKR